MSGPQSCPDYRASSGGSSWRLVSRRRPTTCNWVAMSRNAGNSDASNSKAINASTAAGSASSDPPGTRSAKTREPCVAITVRPRSAQQRLQVGQREAARRRVIGRIPPERVAQCVQRLIEAAGGGAVQHGGHPVRGNDADHPTRAQDPARRQQRCGRDHRRSRARCAARRGRKRQRCDDVEQTCRVALNATDPIRHSRIGRSPNESGERIGAGVDHRDPVAEFRQRHREPTGAAPSVEDVELVTARDIDEVGKQRSNAAPDDGRCAPNRGYAVGRRP